MGGKGVDSAAAGRVIAQDTELYYTVGFSSSFYRIPSPTRVLLSSLTNHTMISESNTSYFLFLFVAFKEHHTELAHLIS